MLLKNKVAIVTGGTRGIGAAIVKKFVKEGCRVAFTYNKNKTLASRIERSAKGRAVGYRVDVKNSEDMKTFAGAVKRRFKKVDILVNNAGIIRDMALMMMDKKAWDEVIDTNLTGAFNATKACIVTFMKQKRGNIINIASVSGIWGVGGQTNYGASKAGLIGFTKALTREVGPYNIRVNVIAPGFIETDMIQHLKDPLRSNMIERTPLKRLGSSGDIADLALFLASDNSSFITGQTIIIDGGLTA